MYALEGNKETSQGKEMARWYGNESFLNQYIMFADAINEAARANDAIQRKQDLAASRVARNDALNRLLSELPDEFTRKDVVKVLKTKGKAQSGTNTYISRLIQREMIMRVGGGFKKLL